jgi:spermidine synthase
MWTYTIGSKVHDPEKPMGQTPPGTRYYSEEIHRAAFVLPPFVEEILQGRDR